MTGRRGLLVKRQEKKNNKNDDDDTNNELYHNVYNNYYYQYLLLLSLLFITIPRRRRFSGYGTRDNRKRKVHRYNNIILFITGVTWHEMKKGIQSDNILYSFIFAKHFTII